MNGTRHLPTSDKWLYLLRALYLLMAIGGAVQFLPQLIGHEPTARGVIPSMLGGLAPRLRATALEGGREHGAVHRGFQSDRAVPCDHHRDHPVAIRLPAISQEAGGTLALDTEWHGGHLPPPPMPPVTAAARPSPSRSAATAPSRRPIPPDRSSRWRRRDRRWRRPARWRTS